MAGPPCLGCCQGTTGLDGAAALGGHYDQGLGGMDLRESPSDAVGVDIVEEVHGHEILGSAQCPVDELCSECGASDADPEKCAMAPHRELGDLSLAVLNGLTVLRARGPRRVA